MGCGKVVIMEDAFQEMGAPVSGQSECEWAVGSGVWRFALKQKGFAQHVVVHPREPKTASIFLP